MGVVQAGVAAQDAGTSSTGVVAWGDTSRGQTAVPAGLTNVIAVAAGQDHSLALTADGTVVAWGDDTFGEATVSVGLTSVTAIAAGGNHSLALTTDGQVVGWGENGIGQTTPPPGLSDVIAVAAGGSWSMALRQLGLGDAAQRSRGHRMNRSRSGELGRFVQPRASRSIAPGSETGTHLSWTL